MWKVESDRYKPHKLSFGQNLIIIKILEMAEDEEFEMEWPSDNEGSEDKENDPMIEL